MLVSPNTIWLLVVANAFAPITVILLSVARLTLALKPKAVLFAPVVEVVATPEVVVTETPVTPVAE